VNAQSESQSVSIDGNSGRLPWAGFVFIASALAIPACYLIGASLSGENHFGQGLEGSAYWLIFCAVQAFSFVGLTFSPCLRSGSDNRQAMFMVLGVVAFVVDNFLSVMFIAVAGFPD